MDEQHSTQHLQQKHLLLRQDGVVLVAALWVSALILWIAMMIGSEIRMQGEEQIHRIRRSQALHLAIGGVYEALSHMGQALPTGLEEAPETVWLPDGKAHVIGYSTGRAIVLMESESEKVNVNRAGLPQIQAVLERVGMETESAGQLAARMVDFIDRDNVPQLNGAEGDQYEKLGLPYGPFDNPLTSLDQMLLVPGITPQIFYGYGRQETDEDLTEEEMLLNTIFPSRNSLFRRFTVYGRNTTLMDPELERMNMEQRIIPWEASGTYTILSYGEASTGPPAVVIWLVVRYAPETDEGYEVLYRKIL